MSRLEEIQIDKLVNGGQVFGTLADGRKAFIWNALPGERVVIRITKQKRAYVEAIAEDILEESRYRIVPKDSNFLSTSPWQIMDFAYENDMKATILADVFQQAKIELPEQLITFHDEQQWAYRNKMEYVFYGDDQGLHLALHERGSHMKQIVTGSSLALPALDRAASELLTVLANSGIRAGDLKSLILRTNQTGMTLAALFVKIEPFPKLLLPASLAGLEIYFSEPKSPASVATRLLQSLGQSSIADTTIGGLTFNYDALSFFQGNVPVYRQLLHHMQKTLIHGQPVIDMYAGVGSIGLSITNQPLTIVEIDPRSAAMAAKNAQDINPQATVLHCSSDQALDVITAGSTILLDPPRAGLSKQLVERLVDVQPELMLYVSCNPATQTRDLARLLEAYTLKQVKLYNFFPRTPHIESLAVLKKR